MNVRPTLWLALSLCTVLAFASVRPAHAQLGIAAGANFDNFSDIDYNDRQATFDNATGYHFGVFYDLAAGGLAIRPGVFYRQVGDVTYDFDVVQETFDLNLIEVPIDLRLRVPLPIIKPYVMAGPVLSFASSSDEDFDENLKNLSLTANIGAGVEVALLGLRLFPEVRYAFGVTGFMNETIQIGNVQIEAEEEQRLTALMLRLGIGF